MNKKFWESISQLSDDEMSKLRKNSAERHGPGSHMDIFLKSRRLTQKELATWLGISQPSVAQMKITGITRTTALALAAIDRGLKPYEPTPDDISIAQDGSTDDEVENE